MRAGEIVIPYTNFGGQTLTVLDVGVNAYLNDRLLVNGNVSLIDAGDDMTCVALRVG